MGHVRLAAFLAVLLSLASPDLHAQAGTTYKARLSPVPMDIAMAATIAGSGSATAVLNGAKLTITGSFEGLKSPATSARIHRGQRGVRGPAILDLQVSSGTAGTISAALDLTPAQVADLRGSRLYIQLYSEKAPEGNLWGWLLPQEMKR